MAGQLGWAAFQATPTSQATPTGPPTSTTVKAPPVTAIAPVGTFSVVGSVQGVAVTEFGVPDRGGLMKFVGQGRTNLAVNTAVIGWRSSPGFVRQGLCTGDLQLMTAQGWVILAMTSAEPVAGFAPCPSTMHWTVKAGKGAYAHKAGKGCVDISSAGADSEMGGPSPMTMAFRLWRHGQCYPSPPSSASR
jgi:hypothetical protein